MQFSVAQLCQTFCSPLAPLSLEYFRQEDWCGLSSPPDLPDPGMERASPASPALQVDSLLLRSWEKEVRGQDR